MKIIVDEEGAKAVIAVCDLALYQRMNGLGPVNAVLSALRPESPAAEKPQHGRNKNVNGPTLVKIGPEKIAEKDLTPMPEEGTITE